MSAWETLPTFYANSEQIDNSSDLNLIRNAARLVDGWTFQNLAAFDSSAGLDTGTPLYYVLDDPFRLWWGAVRMVAGCTNIVIEGRATKTGSETIQVYVNGNDTTGSGTLVGTIALAAGTNDFVNSYSITGLGLADGAIAQVELRIAGSHTSVGTYIITDVYLNAINKSGWVAPPNFSTVASATDAASLNALCTSLQWVYDRIRLVPLPAHLALYYALGSFKTGDPQHVNRPIWVGSIPRYYSNSYFKLRGWVQSMTTTGWNLLVYLNGVLTYTSPTYGIGAQLIDQSFDLSAYTLGSRVRVGLNMTATNQGTADPLRFTRLTFGIMHAVASGAGWPYATLPTAFVGPSATTNAGTLRAALASLSTIVNDAKTRIDGRPEQWARSRAMRRYYTRTSTPTDLYIARARPFVWQRVGNELIVKGKDIKLGYGPLIAGIIDVEGNGWEKWSTERMEGIDATAGITAWLDDFDGLDYGTSIHVFGDPLYAAETIG